MLKNNRNLGGASGESFGSYKDTIDAKNRLFIPAKMRNKLGSTFECSARSGGSDCLYIYSDEGGMNGRVCYQYSGYEYATSFFGGMDLGLSRTSEISYHFLPNFTTLPGLKNVVVAGVGKRL